MDKKLSEVEIQKQKKKSDDANMLIRASKVNSHCGITLEKYMVITIYSLSTELL